MRYFRFSFLFVLLLSFLFLTGAFVQNALSEPQKIAKITFEKGLQKLLKKNAALIENKANILTFEAYQDELEYAGVPRISFLSFVAPNFRSTGNALESKSDLSKWGPTIHLESQIVWPFYSLGRISLAKKAAKQGVEAYKNLHKSKINKIIFEYKKIYLSLILLKQFKTVLEEAEKQSKEILKEAQKKYSSGTGKILRKDLSRLKIYNLEIEKLKEERLASQRSAHLALGHYLGERRSYDATDEEFPDISEETFLLQRLIDLSFKKSPDLKGLRLGIKARENLLKYEKKGLLPVFFIAAQISVDHTPVREEQTSSFAFDPFNRVFGGAAAGVNWNFDWSKYKSNVKKAQAEYEKILAQKKQADTGYPLEISIAFWEMQKNKKLWRFSQNKLKEARKWSLSEYTSYTSGIGNAKDLVDSLAAYYLSQREVAEAEYNYLVSWSKLAFKVGESALLKKW